MDVFFKIIWSLVVDIWCVVKVGKLGGVYCYRFMFIGIGCVGYLD